MNINELSMTNYNSNFPLGLTMRSAKKKKTLNKHDLSFGIFSNKNNIIIIMQTNITIETPLDTQQAM